MNRRLEETPETLAEQAADWIVRLSADEAGERRAAESGFAAWKQADPRHAAAAAALKVAPSRCLVVEDTVTGVTAGVAAGATVVGYSPSSVGHSSPEALRAAGAVQVIADMALLPALLA